MGSGLIQLLAIGQQDIYLKLNPSLTFFKKVFKTHSNFSVETISVEMNRTDVLVNDNTTFKIKIPRHGDLMAQIYFTIYLPGSYYNNAILYPNGYVVNQQGYQVGTYANGQFIPVNNGAMVAQQAPQDAGGQPVQQQTQPQTIVVQEDGWSFASKLISAIILMVICVVLFFVIF